MVTADRRVASRGWPHYSSAVAISRSGNEAGRIVTDPPRPFGFDSV